MKSLLAIFPSAGVLFLFWLAIKSLVEADRRERAAEARLTRQERAVAGEGPAESEVAGAVNISGRRKDLADDPAAGLREAPVTQREGIVAPPE